MKRILGISLASGVCGAVATGILFAHTNLFASISVAVIGIVIGATIAHGHKNNCAPTGAGK